MIDCKTITRSILLIHDFTWKPAMIGKPCMLDVFGKVAVVLGDEQTTGSFDWEVVDWTSEHSFVDVTLSSTSSRHKHADGCASIDYYFAPYNNVRLTRTLAKTDVLEWLAPCLCLHRDGGCSSDRGGESEGATWSRLNRDSQFRTSEVGGV